jgi:hypothetical protein
MSGQCGNLRGVIRPRGVLTGTINAAVTLVGALTPYGRLVGVITVPSYIDSDPYEGVYTVKPKLQRDIVMETAGKTMRQDVTVEKIPICEVSNSADGKTLIIGEEAWQINM